MSSAELDELRQQVHDLTNRVARLEARLAIHPDASPVTEAVPSVASWAEQGPGALAAPESEASSTLPVFGAATLGLAGAYLLRAIAESGVLPARLMLATATLYAVAWLVWAPRGHAAVRRFSSTVFALTATLILAPLLWEATLRFHTITPGQTSVILVAFTVIGLAISWQQDLLIAATISILAGVATAGALLIATDELLPFIFVFLAIAAAVEACACFNHWLGERWLTAAAADCSVVLATWVVTRPEGLPAGYAAIPASGLLLAQMALLVIYLSSAVVRTLWRGRPFTNFETGQCILAFMIGLGGAVRVASENAYLIPAVAGFAVLCGATCYAISFKVLFRQDARGRNFYTYSTFGILLIVFGCRIPLSNGGVAIVWSLLALACIAAGGIWGRLTLAIHGGVYLLLALALSGALRDSARLLLGTDAWPASIPTALWIGAAVSGAAYVLAAWLSRSIEGSPALHAFRVAIAAALVWLLLGLTAASVTCIYHETFAVAAGDSYCATLRTGTVVGMTLLLAWVGARLRFQDLTQLVYPLIIFGAYRLLTDDLHQPRKAALFLSLLLYGTALIALARLRRPRPDSSR